MVEPKKHVGRFNEIHRQAEARVGKVMRLGRNEWTIPFPEDHLRAMLATISGEDMVAVPELQPLYAKLSAFLDVPRDYLLLCTGSDSGIKLVFEAYVDEGDEVISIDPTYHRYKRFCELYDARRVAISYDADVFLDVERIVQSIKPRTKLVLIINPNNPTGSVMRLDELRRIVERARANDALVLVDEAYHYYSSVTVLPWIDQFDNLIVLRSFSKSFGVAGASIGLVATGPTVMKHLEKLRSYPEITGVSAKIGEYLLDHPEIMQEHVDMVSASKQRLATALQLLGFRLVPGGSLASMIRLPDGVDRSEFVNYCMSKGHIEIGSYLKPPLERYIRVAIGPWEQMQALVEICELYSSVGRPLADQASLRTLT